MKNFNLFKKRCQYWIKKLGMNNYGVLINVDKIDITDRAMAYIKVDDETFLASIFFVTHNNKKASVADIEDSAKHEVIHLLLGRMSKLGTKRFCSNDEIYAAEEEVVQRLLKIIK